MFARTIADFQAQPHSCRPPAGAVWNHVASAFLLAASVAALSLTLAGCSVSKLPAPASADPSTLPQISGKVHGGQQPISGATIQLYAASTTALKGASTALLTTAVVTDSTGGFNITGDYTCPTSGALVYLVATGGNPGLPGSVDNTAIALMSVLGTCGTLTSSTFISINELTTVASVVSLAPFMADYAHIGARSSSLSIAFRNAVASVNPSNGAFNTVAPDGPVQPTALLSTLADILAACVNTYGGATGDKTPCGSLFKYTTGTTGNTISSLLYIDQNPVTNVDLLFSLITANSPFQPALGTSPTSFAGSISVRGFANYNSTEDRLISDRQGHIWRYQPDYYNNDDIGGRLTQYDTELNVIHSYSVSNNVTHTGNSGRSAILDPFDNLWVLSDSTVYEIGPDGTIKSPVGGYSLVNNGFLAYSIQSDSSGNIWASGFRLSDDAVCTLKYSPAFSLISPQTGYCSEYIYDQNVPEFLTADSTGNMYQFTDKNISNTRPVIKYSGSGSASTFANLTGDIFASAYDDVNNHLLSYDVSASGGEIFSSFDSDGNSIFTGSSSDLDPSYYFSLTTDGAGNLWSATDSNTLAAVSPSGSILSACNPYNCAIPVVDNSVSTASLTITGIAIDDAGDIFTENRDTGSLLKFTGLAVPR